MLEEKITKNVDRSKLFISKNILIFISLQKFSNPAAVSAAWGEGAHLRLWSQSDFLVKYLFSLFLVFNLQKIKPYRIFVIFDWAVIAPSSWAAARAALLSMIASEKKLKTIYIIINTDPLNFNRFRSLEL